MLPLKIRKKRKEMPANNSLGEWTLGVRYKYLLYLWCRLNPRLLCSILYPLNYPHKDKWSSSLVLGELSASSKQALTLSGFVCGLFITAFINVKHKWIRPLFHDLLNKRKRLASCAAVGEREAWCGSTE